MSAATRDASAKRVQLRALAACVGLILLAVAALGYQAAYARRAAERAERAERHRPVDVLQDGYVSSAECRRCHAAQYQSWSSSYHRTMTQVATPASVFGAFDGRSLDGYRVSREADRYFVDLPATDPYTPSGRFPISLVTGSHHMQVYWYELGQGRVLGQLPFAYLKAEKRWVPREAIFLEPPTGQPRPPEAGRWNSSCLACHTTHAKPRALQDGYDTQVAEFGIACEACHGPGAEHVKHEVSPLARYRSHFGAKNDSKIVHPGKLDHQRASQICSQCHAMWQHRGLDEARAWNEHGFKYRPGEDPNASMWLLQPSQAAKEPMLAQTLREQRAYVDGQFWSDGTARVSGREFSGMVESPCYARGELSCLSCHSMHKAADDPRPLGEWANDQLIAGMEGDKACLQCHREYETKLTEHTGHAAKSSGSRCYNCHMPYTSYGLMKAIRSHRIEVPDVRTAIRTGRPNACTSCHLDRSLGWAAQQLEARYEIPAPELSDLLRTVEASLLLGLTGDAGQRALTAWAAGWADAVAASPNARVVPMLGQLMEDPYTVVRYIAERSLRARGDVDFNGFAYDFVAPPKPNAGLAQVVASRASAQPSAADAQRLRELFAQLLPMRDPRPVLLLE